MEPSSPSHLAKCCAGRAGGGGLAGRSLIPLPINHFPATPGSVFHLSLRQHFLPLLLPRGRPQFWGGVQNGEAGQPSSPPTHTPRSTPSGWGRLTPLHPGLEGGQPAAQPQQLFNGSEQRLSWAIQLNPGLASPLSSRLALPHPVQTFPSPTGRPPLTCVACAPFALQPSWVQLLLWVLVFAHTHTPSLQGGMLRAWVQSPDCRESGSGVSLWQFCQAASRRPGPLLWWPHSPQPTMLCIASSLPPTFACCCCIRM